MARLIRILLFTLGIYVMATLDLKTMQSLGDIATLKLVIGTVLLLQGFEAFIMWIVRVTVGGPPCR